MKSKGQRIDSVKEAAFILGDKWTPELLRYLVNEDCVGFCQLQDLVGGINPRTLSNRLATLEQHEIIEKQQSATSSRCRYKLTKKGNDLIPILLSMRVWSEKYS